MLNKLKRVGSRGRIGNSTGQMLIKEVLLRVSWKFKTSLSSRRDSSVKFLLNFIRLAKIRCLILRKGEGVKIHLVRNLLLPNVVRSIWVNAWWEQKIAFLV